jgi:hypothetical protein
MLTAAAPRDVVEPAWTVARAPPTELPVEAVTEEPTAEDTTKPTEVATYVLRALAVLMVEGESGMYPLTVSSRTPE